ncbi:MAG: hypothetical protein RDV48_05445 [Candidatus Eremiobacteraeota bacterium]|nr:hypothetical protein [Candidatus Eremiobacteraeota bacterium]
MDNIKNIITQAGAQSLRGGMKVANDAAPVDTFSPSGSSDKSFLEKMKDKLKGIFSHDDDSQAQPQKEPGGWYCAPGGQPEWHPQSNPPPPQNAYGHWAIDTACGAADWYWQKNFEPAEGPTYGPAYRLPGSDAAPAPPPAQEQKP